MNKLLLIFLILSNISFAQKDKIFLKDFLLEDEIKSENELIYGIIGDEHQRILIKLISIKKNTESPNEYLVVGKSSVKETIWSR